MLIPWRPSRLDRQIMSLALPALGALIAEPLFLLADSAMVGHLGATALAGLGLAAAILQTLVGLMVFLAYGTTPAVARRLGQGDEAGAIAVGVDGLWMAAGLGLLLAAAGSLSTPWLVAIFSPAPEVAAQAVIYLRLSMLGIPALLLVFAASGLLRGLQDTRTPLWVASIGFAANIVLNYLLMYGWRWGIAGAAIGSVLAQWGMVAAYLLIINRHRQHHRSRWHPHWAGIKLGAASGGWLFLRTLTLRAAMLLAIYVATLSGAQELAAFHIAMTLLATVAFALDALAIAAQALIDLQLGAAQTQQVHAILRRCMQWGMGFGVTLGLLLILGSGSIGSWFTSDLLVREILPPALIILGLSIPVGAAVWVLDGVLIGASDMRYLGLAGLVNFLLFAPLALAVLWLAPAGAAGLAWLMASFCTGFLGARLLTLGWRVRNDNWMQQALPR